MDMMQMVLMKQVIMLGINKKTEMGNTTSTTTPNTNTTKPSSQTTKTSQSSGGFIGAAASVVNNLVSNIFGQKNKNRELDLKAAEQKFQDTLSNLSNEQKYVLQQQLNNAQTQSERLKILEGAVTQIKVAQLNNAGSNQMKTAYLVLGSAVVLVGLLLVIKKVD
jgi:hypothetical protein